MSAEAAGDAPGDSGLPVRVSARILLADHRDRVLLFKFSSLDSDQPGGLWWGTPGGGVDEGESVPEAAARELFEETGLRIPVSGFDRIVGRSQGPARYEGQDQWYVNHFYFLRTEGFVLDDSGWEELERANIAEHRWWSVPELAATDEIVHPPGLPHILPDLLAGRPPETPLDLSRR